LDEVDAPVGARRCARCRRTKPLADFVKQPTQKYGRGYHCKRCAADRVGVYYRRKKGERVAAS